MEEFLRALIERRTAAFEERAREFESRRSLLEAAAVTGRDQLTGVEQLRHDEYSAKIARLDGEIEGLDHRIEDLNTELVRAGRDNQTARKLRDSQHQGGALNRPALGGFDDEQLRALHQSVQDRQTVRIQSRGFVSVDSQLPPHLQQQIVGQRLMERFIVELYNSPLGGITPSSVDIIRHNSTTGTAAVVAEGALKPEVTPVFGRVNLPFEKIAANTGVSTEIMSDWPAFVDYVRTELMSHVVSVENRELLNGDGTTDHLAGLLTTSGILTRATGADAPLDVIESAIAQLRTGSALAVADLLVLHPNTWSAIRRAKDANDRYLATADPTRDEAMTAWGVPVFVTTDIAAGVGGLVDTRKFGKVLVREPLTLQTGWTADDFTRNLVRFIAEERLVLAVERPAAVLKITGLPTT